MSIQLALLRTIAFFLPIMTSTSIAANDATTHQRVVTVEGISEYQFKNGLRVLLFPDLSRPRVTVNMTVLVGSRHEGYGESGMAHLLEHMVFKGTPSHPNIPKLLQDHGARFNGTTSTDRTNYYETLTASDDNLEFALRLEADRLVNSLIKKEDLESEFSVVRNEFESGENSPNAVLSKRVYAAAFEWHNYGKSTIGNRSDIERVPIDKLRAFYRKYYQSDNVVLIVAGQFQESRALELIDKYFGSLPRPERELDRTYTEEPPQDGERVVTLRRVGDVGAVAVAYHVPAGPHEEWPAVQVLANILSTQPSGRLYKKLVETKLAASVFASVRAQHDPGLMTIQASVREPQRLDEVRDVIIEEVEAIGASGVSEEEVNRARQQILKSRELAAGDSSQLAISLSDWAAQGDWRLYFLHRDRIEKVAPEHVREAAARYLLRNNRTVGVFIPTEKAERIAVPARPDVDALVANYVGREGIAAGEAFDASPQEIEKLVTRTSVAGGIQVALLPKKSRGEEVHCVLTLRYGDEQSLRGYQMASGFLGPLMMRGTKSLSYQQLRDELDRLNASLSSGSGGRRGRGGSDAGSLGEITFTIQAKRNTLPEVLEILRQVLREPLLPQDQFEIMKRERLASFEQMRTDPGSLATIQLRRELSNYPPEDVRYAPTVDESIQRLEGTTHEQVQKLYSEFLGAHAGQLAIVGDFDPEVCMPILEKGLSGWIAMQPYARIVTLPPTLRNGTRQRIDTPDKANATYMSGFVFPLNDADPDYPSLVIANYIAGGGSLSSRLGTRVRQQEGLSYGVGTSLSVSSFEPRAIFASSAICNPQNVGKAESVIDEELAKLVRDGVQKAELEDARRGFLESRRITRSSDSSLAGILASHSYLGRTMAHDEELDRKIAALTPETVNSAIKKHIRLEELFVVTAGDFKAAGN